jgi:hypothetical protein
MKRRHFLALAAASAFIDVAAIAVSAAPSLTAGQTRWRVRTSEGFDALCFLGPLSGDPFYTEYYGKELAAFLPRLNPATVPRIKGLGEAIRKSGGMLGPTLCLLFSAGDASSLEALIASLDHAERDLQPVYAASPYWDAEGWGQFLAGRETLRAILVDLQAAGFARFRKEHIAAREAVRLPKLEKRLSGLDVVGADEKMMGRTLADRSIEVILLYFSQPHGIRIIGQRFLTHIDYPDTIVIRNAIHELMHPPFDAHGQRIGDVVAFLGRDPLLAKIVAEHNPSFGYTSLIGYLEEDTVQALEQLVSDQFGVAESPSERWTESDDGMHVLAAGLYDMLKAEGYGKTGGNIEAWLHDAIANGKLAPDSLAAAAAKVLRRNAAKLWPV